MFRFQKSIKRIQSFVFCGCTSLQHISYNGTMKRWARIISKYFYDKLDVKVIHCIYGDLNIK